MNETTHVEYEGVRYRVSLSPSIYVRRAGLRDIRVHKPSLDGSGALYDGIRYSSVAVFAAEDGEVIRQDEPLPLPVLGAAYRMVH